MVFFQQKKRSNPTTAANGMATLTDLPTELLFQVLGKLDNLSVLRLRLTCSAMLPSCDTVVQQRFKILYCHPTAKAMKHALSICNHPVFNQTIEEVVVLGKVVWRDIEKAYPGYRKDGLRCIPSTREALAAETGRFCFWPDRSHRILEHALSKLPKLNKLAFAQKVGSSGWNQISSATIDAYYRKYSSKVSKEVNEVRLTEFQSISRLLYTSDLRFLSCRVDIELPFLDVVHERHRAESQVHCADSQDDASSDSGSSSLDVCSPLTTLEMVADSGWAQRTHPPVSLLPYRCLILHSEETPKSLSIVLKANLSKKVFYFDGTLRYLFQNCKFPRLERLNIQLQQDLYESSPKRHRPVCNNFDLPNFLAKSCSNLKSLNLHNVTFCYEYADRSMDVRQTIRAVMKQLVESPTFEAATWRIDRHRHDPRCKNPEVDDPTECRSHICGYYEGAADLMAALDGNSFDTLADEMGVDFEPGAMSWDFGQATKTELEPDTRRRYRLVLLDS